MNDFYTNAVPIITALTGLLGVILGFVGVILTFSVSKRTLKMQALEEERKSIYEKINTFYGPFQQLQGVNRELYKVFRARRGEDFRTLRALLQGEKFEGNDKILLDNIIDNSERLEKLIIDKSGLIDSEELRKLLWTAATHFRLIQLASQGVLIGEIERFEPYIFPRTLDDTVDEEIRKLKRRLEEIKGYPTTDLDAGK